MTQVNMHEAKTQLSRLVEQASRGEEVVIARDGEPVVRLVAVKGGPRKGRRRHKRWPASVLNFEGVAGLEPFESRRDELLPPHEPRL
jgi:prevent-host-death family protein